MIPITLTKNFFTNKECEGCKGGINKLELVYVGKVENANLRVVTDNADEITAGQIINPGDKIHLKFEMPNVSKAFVFVDGCLGFLFLIKKI